MGKVAHLSRVKVTREPGKNKIKRVQVEGFPEVERLGVHGGIAEYFKVQPDEPRPSTLDAVVGAVGGCLTGTLAGALEGRGLRSDPEKLEALAEGTLEEIDGKLLLTNITVTYKIKVPKGKRDTAERVLQHHESRCPVSESIKRGITIDWKSEIVEEESAEG
jgi:uncharacterized OsmC-like protein